jgi:SAM-dependent methyltransferase
LVVETMEDGAKTKELALSDHDLKLGRWLVDSLRTSDESMQIAPSLKEMEYFIGSGAYRAQALAATLRAGFENRAYRAAMDIGAGIGMLPYLVTPLFGVEQVTLVEPLARYEQTARSLWQTTLDVEMNFLEMTAEQQCAATDIHNPVDLIIICQCFFRVSAPRRKEVLARAWETLRPGGVLAMNEILDNGNRTGPGGAPLLPPEEITALFADLAQPRVYLGRDRWQKGHLISDLDRSAFVSDTFIAAQKTADHS